MIQKKSKIIKIYNKIRATLLLPVFSIFLFIIYLPSYFMKEKKFLKRQLNFDNEITLKIVGNGTQWLVYQHAFATPSEIYINGELQGSAGKSINIEGDESQETYVTIKFSSPISNAYRLFFFLDNIVEIDLSKFDTSALTGVEGMFSGCISLTSINFGNISTSSVKIMKNMFNGCDSLVSLDLSNFNTSNVENMEMMFYNCYNLESLNVDNFDTNNINSMNSMFYHCNSLTTLDLSSFTTTNVSNMKSLFEQCNALISLNLESFDTSKVEEMSLIFYGCSSLISLNLGNFDTSSLAGGHDYFTNVPNNIVFCYEPSKLTKISNEISNYENDCDNVCFTAVNKKLLVGEKRCTDDCKNVAEYQYEYNSICYNTCPDDTHYSYDNLYLCQKDPEGYFLDENSIYKQCYESCKSCNGEGDIDNHNCITCKSNYRKIDDIGKENNCYRECDYYFYFDSSGNYGCTDNNNCPNNYNKLISEKSKCIDECKNDDTYQYEYNNKCYSSTCPANTYVSSDNMYLCQMNPEGYYLDSNYIYQPCYTSCKFCSGQGEIDNHKCTDCKTSYTKIDEIGKENNCYIKCSFLYYFDESGVYQCADDNNCPIDYNKLISEKGKCIDECKNDDTYHYEYNNECYTACPPNTYYSYDNMNLCKMEPEGYYLDENYIYKQCYGTCK